MSAEGRQDVAEQLSVKRLTVDGRARLVHQAVALNDTVGLLGLAPGHVDRRGGELTEVDEAGSTGRFGRRKEEKEGRTDFQGCTEHKHKLELTTVPLTWRIVE